MSSALEALHATVEDDFDGDIIEPGHPDYDAASRTVLTAHPSYSSRSARLVRQAAISICSLNCSKIASARLYQPSASAGWPAPRATIASWP